MSGVYKITNIVNGKIYIGSSKNIAMRWQSHIFDLSHNTHHNKELLKDFTKYGIENFNFSIIEIIVDVDKLLECEQMYIDKFNSIKNGYNSSNAKKQTETTSTIKINIKKINEAIDIMAKNSTIITPIKRIDISPELDRSYSYKWFMDSGENCDKAKRFINNIKTNRMKCSSYDFFWHVPYGVKHKALGNVNTMASYNDVVITDKGKRQNLIFASNVFPHPMDRVDKNIYAAMYLINWITHCSNIDYKFNICFSSPRMEYIYREYILNKKIFLNFNDYTI